MNTLKLTIAALAIGLTSTTAQAADQQIELRINASELASEQGTKRVLRRIENLSRSACKAPAFVPHSMVRECREEIAQQFIAQLDNARLSRLAGYETATTTGKGA
ncbi:MAG: UrcA family protein [Erythrobacter sp.]